MSLYKRDLLSLRDYSVSDLQKILELALQIKSNPAPYSHNLDGVTVNLVFMKPSTRTRVSLEVAIRELGGFSLYQGISELQLKRGETLADTARVLSRYVTAIAARVYKQSDLEELVSYATIPVINCLSDLCHPLQILADLMTIREQKGGWKGVKVAYIGDGNNVCNSLLIGCAKMGMTLSVATPPEYEPNREFLDAALRESERRNAVIELVNEPKNAVKDADILYTDVFTSMGQEEEYKRRLETFHPTYQVREELFSSAAPKAIFMHPLPCHRGEEVEARVIDGERSVVWDQAENRLHTAKAVFNLILHP